MSQEEQSWKSEIVSFVLIFVLIAKIQIIGWKVNIAPKLIMTDFKVPSADVVMLYLFIIARDLFYMTR